MNFLNRKKIGTYLLALIPFVLLTLFFEIIPLVMTIFRSFLVEGGTGITLDHYFAIFTKPLYQQAIVNSLIISIASACVGIVIGFFGAKAGNSTDSKTKTWFMTILNMTSNFAGVPLAFSYMIMFGSTGVFVIIGSKLGIDALAHFDLYTVTGLAFIYIYFQIPLATLLLFPAFEGIRKEWIDSVKLLGGSMWEFWKSVGIPVLTPAILGTMSVLFANALAAYATAYALLQNNFSLLPIRITEQFVGDIVQRPAFGSALAVVMMLLMVLAVLLQNYMVKKQGGRNQ